MKRKGVIVTQVITVEIDKTRLVGKMVYEVVRYLRDIADEIETDYGSNEPDPDCPNCDGSGGPINGKCGVCFNWQGDPIWEHHARAKALNQTSAELLRQWREMDQPGHDADGEAVAYVKRKGQGGYCD